MDKQIQDKIDKFFEQYGKNKIKQINNHCAKRKKTCPHLKDGKCIRGWCLV